MMAWLATSAFISALISEPGPAWAEERWVGTWATSQQTSHPGSRTTSYLLAGDHVAAASLPGAKTFDHWFNIAGIDVMGGDGAVSVIGDSITDGRGSTTNGNDRWTDDLARRLAAAGR